MILKVMFREAKKQNKRQNKSLSLSISLLLFCPALICTALVLSSCSGSGGKNKNPISPYDPEFREDYAKKMKAQRQETEEGISSEEQLLNEAISAYDQGLYTLAKEKFRSLQDNYPNGYYNALAELKIADSNYYVGEYTAAVTGYEEFIRMRPKSDAAPYAQYQIANAHKQRYSGTFHDQAPLTAAYAAFTKLIENYPDSEYVASAKKALKEAHENLGENESLVAEFYYKQGKLKASTNRFKTLFKLYPDTNAARSSKSKVGQYFPDNKELLALAKNISDSEPLIADSSKTQIRESSLMASSAARFKFSEMQNPNTAQPKPEKQMETASSKIKYSVNCSAQDLLKIITVNLNDSAANEIKLASVETVGNQLLITIGNSADKIISEDSKCEESDITAQLKNDGEKLLLSLKSPSGIGAYRVFHLDRPQRIITVLVPAHTLN